jgi:hypothetical protein
MPNKPSILQPIVSNPYLVWYILGMDLHNPHDTFFTAYFADPTMLLHLLHFTLPKEVFALLQMLRYITQIWAKDAKKEPAAPLFNLTSLQDDMIEGPPEFTAALWAMKYARGQIDKWRTL